MLLKISIEYCAVCHLTDRALNSAAVLLENFEPEIDSITLIPSDGGRFEITVNGNLIYSRLETRRHIEAPELTGLVKKYMEDERR